MGGRRDKAKKDRVIAVAGGLANKRKGWQGQRYEGKLGEFGRLGIARGRFQSSSHSREETCCYHHYMGHVDMCVYIRVYT